MAEIIGAREMARLLDEWVSDKHPFNPGFSPSFGLSDEQRREPVVKTAATFAGFAFMGHGDQAASVGPFILMLGEASELLDYIKNEYPEALGWWHDFSVYVEDRFLAAKLQDLLWIVRYTERQAPAKYARDAIENYLRFYDQALSRDFEHKQIHLHDLLSRVADLSSEINAADEFHPVAGERCRAWLEAASEEDYIWPIRVAERLLESYRPTDLDDYVQALHTHYADSDDHQRRTLRDGLFKLELAMATTDHERSRIRSAAAEMFLAEARLSSHAMFTLAHLRSAGEWAQGSANESRLTREIRDLRSTLDLSAELKEISVEGTIPGQEVQQLRDWIVEPEDFLDSLARLVSLVAGWLQDLGGLQDRLQSARQENRLMDIIPVTYVHHDGFECCRPRSSEERHEKEMATEHANLAVFAAKLWLAESLDAIRDRYALEPATMAEFVTEHGLINQVDGEAFGRAFRHYWSADYDSAANVALPRIESAMRSIAFAVGAPVISLPKEGRRRKCAGYKPLGAILPQLDEFLGKNAVRMLQYLLVDNHGMNLRNNYAHGIPSDDPQTDAAISLWIVLWLGFLRGGD